MLLNQKSMQNQLKLLENEFKQELNELIGSGKFINVQNALSICQLHLQKSKDFFLSQKSVNPSDEIYYFKYFKPKILAKIIFYRKINDIQIEFPLGDEEVRLRYIKLNLQNGHLFFKQYNTIITYYRHKREHLDENFFIRENARLHSDMEHRFLSLDFTHSTGYDEILAEYIALVKVQEFLEGVQKDTGKLHLPTISTELNESSELKWTSSKSALVEMIYGLNAVGAVNDGKMEVKRIAFWMGSTFNIDIGDVYKTYAEIKNRKGNRTKFLDSLAEGLNNRMNADEAGLN
jgi:hypothetical protein